MIRIHIPQQVALMIKASFNSRLLIVEGNSMLPGIKFYRNKTIICAEKFGCLPVYGCLPALFIRDREE